MAFVEDHSVFLADFGVLVTLGAAQVRAIFDNGYARADVGYAGMSTTQPSLTLATADVPASPVGLAVVADSASYAVAVHQPDGTGISILLLERAP